MTTDQLPTMERLPLKGHKPLSYTTLQGWPAITFGVVCLIAGSPILAIGLGWFDFPKSSIHSPLWVLGIFGGLFVTCGVHFIVHGVQGLHRLWNISNGKRQLPASPWLWDYPWYAHGITDNKFKGSLNSMIALIVFCAILAPFNWIAFVSESGGIFWQLLTGFFDAIILISVGGYLLKSLGQFWAFGNGRVSFPNFPYFLGQTMTLTIEQLPSEIRTVQLDLRCIEEAYEIQKRGRRRESVVICYQIFHDTQTIRGELINEIGQLRCSWSLPDAKHLSSTPSERPAKFWELEVKGERHGLDYHCYFLLPIYYKN